MLKAQQNVDKLESEKNDKMTMFSLMRNLLHFPIIQSGYRCTNHKTKKLVPVQQKLVWESRMKYTGDGAQPPYSQGLPRRGGEGNCYRTNRGPPFSQGLPRGLFPAKDILRGASLPTGVTSYEASTLSPKIYLTETSQGLPQWVPSLPGATSGLFLLRGLLPSWESWDYFR